jgi:hypothetical protein
VAGYEKISHGTFDIFVSWILDCFHVIYNHDLHMYDPTASDHVEFEISHVG